MTFYAVLLCSLMGNAGRGIAVQNLICNNKSNMFCVRHAAGGVTQGKFQRLRMYFYEIL